MLIFNIKDIIGLCCLGIVIVAFVVFCIYCGVVSIVEKTKNKKLNESRKEGTE